MTQFAEVRSEELRLLRLVAELTEENLHLQWAAASAEVNVNSMLQENTKLHESLGIRMDKYRQLEAEHKQLRDDYDERTAFLMSQGIFADTVRGTGATVAHVDGHEIELPPGASSMNPDPKIPPRPMGRAAISTPKDQTATTPGRIDENAISAAKRPEFGTTLLDSRGISEFDQFGNFVSGPTGETKRSEP